MKYEADNKIIEKALGQFFYKCDGVVGAEANYQAMLASELEDVFPGRVRRERKLAQTGRGGVDVIVLGMEENPDYVFELKGGAYNSRNALQDVFSPAGVCQDMQKLSKLSIAPDRRWLVAVDAVELGRSLSYRQQCNAVEAAAMSGVGFAYFGHGDESFLLAQPGNKVRYPSVCSHRRQAGRSVDLDALLNRGVLERALRSASPSVVLEADVVSVIYRSLSETGYSTSQIALETYFGFAPGAMQQRPDICLFEPPIDGHFNLYPRGNVAESYDTLKLASLRLMVEVKGGVPLLRRKDSTLSQIYRADIEKLGRWRSIVRKAATVRSVSELDVTYLVIGADMRTTPLSEDTIASISVSAQGHGVQFMYVHMPVEH